MTSPSTSPRRAAALLAVLTAFATLSGLGAGSAAGASAGRANALGARAAQAQTVPPDSVMRDFELTGDYVLWVDGKQVPGQIFHSQPAAAMLVLSSALTSPVLLSPGSGMASTVSLMKIQKKPDSSIDLLADAQLAPQGPIDFTEDEVRFKSEGHSISLKQATPLLGLRRAEEVTAHNPEYLPRITNYALNAPAVAALKKEKRPVTVRVYFGSWCPHCREMVPHALKVEQALKGSGSTIRFEYFGVPPHFGNEAEVKKNAISAVPTGIVYLNGKEIGRILSTAWTAPETTLVTVLKAS